MKVKLIPNGDLFVLEVSGPITDADLQVLKAGITKLLKTGKNRIIIDFKEEQSIPLEVFKEIAKFELIARELAGRIILAGISAEQKRNLDLFYKPQILEISNNLAEALEYFKKPTIESKPKTTSGAPTPVPDKTKDEIRDEELNSLGALRKQIAALEKENQALLHQLKSLVFDRRISPTEAGMKGRIEELELQLGEFLKNVDR